MGAHSFHDTCTEPDVRKAYDSLCSNAAYEEGNGAYSGTIATTRGYRVVSHTPVTPAYADVLSLQRISGLSKWAECEAIAVGEPTKKKQRTISLVSDGFPTLMDVAAKLQIAPQAIVSWEKLSVTPRFSIETVTPKVRQKQWFVDGPWMRPKAYPTRGEALKAARAMFAQARDASAIDGKLEYRVFQRDAADSETIVRGELRDVRSKLNVVINTGELTFSHWLFYGWAAS